MSGQSETRREIIACVVRQLTNHERLLKGLTKPPDRCASKHAIAYRGGLNGPGATLHPEATSQGLLGRSGLCPVVWV